MVELFLGRSCTSGVTITSQERTGGKSTAGKGNSSAEALKKEIEGHIQKTAEHPSGAEWGVESVRRRGSGHDWKGGQLRPGKASKARVNTEFYWIY